MALIGNDTTARKSLEEFFTHGIVATMPPKKKPNQRPLVGPPLVKEVCRRIRLARSLWDALRNAACRGEREKAIALYETLTPEERE